MADAGKVISVQCNHCGAPLDVEESTRFVTCAHCGSKLEVKRTGSAYFTSVLGRIDQATQSMAKDLEAIRRQNELERIDREWEMERQQYAIRDKQGNISYPESGTGRIAGGVIGVVFGVLWTILAASIAGSAPDVGPFPVAKVIFPLFGVIAVIAAIASMVRGTASVGNYRDAQQRYYQRRAEIQREMDKQDVR